MHFKLSKFSNLCRDLNEESATRKNESTTLREELQLVKAERDEMAEELVRLRSQVQSFEQEKEEHRKLKEQLAQYERDGITSANEAIQIRDQAILDIATKLEQALDQLEIERAQRQRRQIIFPARGAKQGQSFD